MGMTGKVGRWAVAAMVVLACAPPVSAREAIGVYRGWAAFRDADRCYAIARPVVAAGGCRTQAAASVATWPGRGLRSSLHIRLSRRAAEGAPVMLTVGERAFRLVVRGYDVWAADAVGDRAVVGALRAGRGMSVETVAPGGRAIVDHYALPGAATAIDAAALACAGR